MESKYLSGDKSNQGSKKRRHNPGVWILYFALGAIPLFAIGQWIAIEEDNRAFAWKMVFVYLFSSLSLLVLIALLALRKYLRDRNVSMEFGLASRWIVYGLSSSFLLLILLFLIPLPSRSLFQMDLPFKITHREDLASNRFGWGNEGVDEKDAESPSAKKGEQSSDPNNKGKEGEKGKPSTSGESSQKSSSSEQKESGRSSGQDSSSKEGRDEGNNSQESREVGGREQSSNQSSKSEDAKEGAEGAANDGKPATNNQSQSKQQLSQNRSLPETSWSFQWNPGALLQWMAVVAIMAAACFYGFLHRRELIAFLQQLLGYRKKIELDKTEQIVGPVQSDVRNSFHSLTNPFAMQGLTREQLVMQLFQALESWGYDKRIERGEEETPDEYVRRIGKRFPEQLDTLKQLGFLYSRIAYSRGRVSAPEVKPLQPVWEWLVRN